MKITIFPKADINTMSKEEAAVFTQKGEVLDLATQEEFFEAVCTYTWSPSLFIDNTRKNDNFIQTQLMVLDIDDKLSLNEAANLIKLLKYACIIGTSTNHQKEKEGVVADRYRLIFPLNSMITTTPDFKATWQYLLFLIPQIDVTCKDPARFYYPLKEAAFYQGERKFPAIKGEENQPHTTVKKDGEPLGKVSTRTQRFIQHGALKGHRHNEFFLAVLDMKAQGYSKEEIIATVGKIMKKISPNTQISYQIDYLYSNNNIQFSYRKGNNDVN